MPNVIVDPLSLPSLMLSLQTVEGIPIGSGTGFIVSYLEKKYLITNKHVFTGRNSETNEVLSDTGAVDPAQVMVWHHSSDRLGQWMAKHHSLINSEGEKKWLEHPTYPNYDVVALEIDFDQRYKAFPLDLSLSSTDLIVNPGEPVAVIGFPFGRVSDGKLPIWKTNYMASDFDINFDGKPVFLVDGRTKPGMSGSPVVARRMGVHRTSRGTSLGGGAIKFMGIYSGRIDENSDVGMVWKTKVLEDILDQSSS